VFIPENPTPCDGKEELFFSDVAMEVKEAKLLCRGCPALTRDKCLEAGMDEDFGVWGGTTVYERTKLRRARNRNIMLRVI